MTKKFNVNQAEAIHCVDKNLCIVAGAGSGKTSVVTHRIAHLIAEHQIKDYRILAITFTNRAAKELKERLTKMIPDSNIHAMTIHALCVRILREEFKQLGFQNQFTIIDTDDQKRILNHIIKSKQIDLGNSKISEVIQYISNNKMAYITTSAAYKYAFSDREKLFATLYEKYELRLQQLESLDFNDLLIQCDKILSDEKIRFKWQNRFSFIHVDEFQDVDNVQYNIIKKLVGENTNLCVVGDPDQCIYTWRGAEIKYILNFEKDFPNTQTIILDENYRSTPEILHAANSLINKNNHRIKKNLTTHNQNGDKVKHFSGSSETEENKYIVDEIRALKNEQVPYQEMAILYRSNFSSRSIEKALIDAKIPYLIQGSIRFFERSEIKDAIAYLRMLVDNAAIDIALDRIINVPRRGVGEKTVESISQLAIRENVRMYDILKRMVQTPGKIKKTLVTFVEMIEKYRTKLETTSIHKTLGLLLAESGYYAMLQDANEEERLENIKSLIQDIAAFEEENEEPTLEAYLQEIMLYIEKEQTTCDAVTLLSVHAAKGNEFDYVFIYNFSEGIFPSEKAIQEGLLEEERRIAYVAMTRARKQLHLCESRGFTFTKERIKTTSRFIKEINPTFIQQVVKQQSYKIPSKAPTVTSKQAGVKKGDKVIHDTFGNGVVVSVVDSIATIAFAPPYGIKKLLATHHTIKKRSL